MGEQISLLITDLCMPVLDGLSLIRHIRESDAELPIVVITGYADEVELDHINDLQVVLFNKPLDFSVLEWHLRHLWPWMP